MNQHALYWPPARHTPRPRERMTPAQAAAAHVIGRASAATTQSTFTCPSCGSWCPVPTWRCRRWACTEPGCSCRSQSEETWHVGRTGNTQVVSGQPFGNNGSQTAARTEHSKAAAYACSSRSTGDAACCAPVNSPSACDDGLGVAEHGGPVAHDARRPQRPGKPQPHPEPPHAAKTKHPGQ